LHYTAERIYPEEQTDSPLIESYSEDNTQALYDVLTEPKNWEQLTRGGYRSYLASMQWGEELTQGSIYNLQFYDKFKIN
jgi:hypothetical protein